MTYFLDRSQTKGLLFISDKTISYNFAGLKRYSLILTFRLKVSEVAKEGVVTVKVCVYERTVLTFGDN